MQEETRIPEIEKVETALHQAPFSRIATHGVARAVDARYQEAAQPDGKDLDPNLIRNFLNRAYPKESIGELTDSQLQMAGNNLLRIAAEHQEHFQSRDKPFITATYAKRLRLRLQGMSLAEASADQGVSPVTITISATKMSKLAGEYLPIGVLLGTEELHLRVPEKNARSHKAGGVGKSSSSAARVSAYAERMQLLAKSGEVVPSHYKGLFDQEEMQVLTLLAYGIKMTDLDKYLKIARGAAATYRGILLTKFGLEPNDTNIGQLAYFAAAYQIVTPNHSLKRPKVTLTAKEQLVFEYAALGKTNLQIASDDRVNINTKDVKELRSKARKKLHPGDGLPWSDPLLAAGHGILKLKTDEEKVEFASSIKQINHINKASFEKRRPLSIDKLTIWPEDGQLQDETDKSGDVIVRPDGRVYKVRRLLSVTEYANRRTLLSDDPEDGTADEPYSYEEQPTFSDDQIPPELERSLGL